MDNGLKQDLAAANSHSVSSSLVISADEAGPQSTPARAPRKIVPKPPVTPVQHPAAQVAAAPAPTPAPQVVFSAPAPSAPAINAPAKATEPPPLPPLSRPAMRGQEQQKGVYKSEGQVFQQMPWIKP